MFGHRQKDRRAPTPATRIFIIDVQQGFINDWKRHIPGRVAALQDKYDIVVASRFVNPPGSFYRTLIGWHRFAPDSADTGFAFVPREDALIVEKARYSCLGPETSVLFNGGGVERVHLCGIATDNCVPKTAVALFEIGIVPVVLADFCIGHGGPACHDAGLLLLRRLIGSSQVVSGEPEPA